MFVRAPIWNWTRACTVSVPCVHANNFSYYCRKEKEAAELRERKRRLQERNRAKLSWVGRIMTSVPSVPVRSATAVAMVCAKQGGYHYNR